MDQRPSVDLDLIADIVGAYVSNNPVPFGDLPQLISDVAISIGRLKRTPSAPAAAIPQPAVSIKKSVTPDYIISLEDGKKFKSLKRALAVRYNMTPAQYRAKWDLPEDYPMVAPSYSAERSRLAKQIGLGRKPSGKKRGRAS